MSKEKRDFDQDAASWDEKPGRVKLANDVADTILKEVLLTSDMDVLDFGCGTGLLTLRVQPLVHSVTGVDSSQKMLDILTAKIKDHNLSNISTKYLDLEQGDVLDGSYHLIVSSMTMHHIQKIRPLLDQFYQVLATPGCLCIADLDLDDDQFHDNKDGVFHGGFDRTELHQVLIEAGFDDVLDRTAAEVMKPTSDGGKRSFNVFLMVAWKRP
jgi:ubiquinone/menaquinone biosynthesis C-methylase UbiE